MQKINHKYINGITRKALREDLRPKGDITTRNIKNKIVSAKIIVGQNCVIGGLNFAREAFKISDKKISFNIKTKDGRRINKGKVVATLKGKAAGILKSERVALNFLGLISGVATKTNQFVKKIKKKSCKICCTRKTMPNLRLIQKYGVKLGGGTNHRFNLSDEILIKDNHIASSKNFEEIILKAIKYKNGKKITIEVDNLKQLKKIIHLNFDRILFDNMSINNLRKAVQITNNRFETEASGGVNLKNVKKIAQTKVDRISIGELTHSINSIDIKLEI